MKNIINVLILLALVVLIVLKLKDNKEIVQNRVFHFDKEQPISVHTKKLNLEDEGDIKLITGNFLPYKEAKINSELQGKIVMIKVDEGAQVRKGQLILKLDDSLLKLQLNALEVKIDGINVDINRFRILDEARAIEGIKLEKAELGLKSAEAQRETIFEQIRKTSIYAPFSGIITKKLTEVGSFAAPGVPLLILTDIHRLKFVVQVPEKDLVLFQINKVYKISLDAFPDVELSGKAVMIGSKGNMGNSFPIQIEVVNLEDQRIKSGMFGKLILDESDDSRNVVIPASSVVGSNVKPRVYIVNNSKARLIDIVISKRIGNTVIVAKGLKENDVIITSGFINIYDGANIIRKKSNKEVDNVGN